MASEILIIEDNEQNLYLVTFILEKHAYKVIQARNGPDGLEMAKNCRPTLILLDIQLPGMDGYTVARRLKEQSGLKNIPIVAITSYAMIGDREKALSAGCDGYIEKPINPDTFIDDIRKFLHD